MGTSISSSGPGSGVSLVPSWVSDLDAVEPTFSDAEQDVEQENGEDVDSRQEALTPLAPPRRFMGARINLNRFATSGSGASMERGLGQYVRKGLGGSSRASQRMAGTARKASALYGVLYALSRGTPPEVDLGIAPARLAGRSAREVVDRIAAALSPSDGTLDSEASRRSISQALCRLIRREPTVDLAALTMEQIELALELFIGEDICSRINLDVGKTVKTKAPSLVTAMERMAQMFRYVRERVAESFRQRRADFGPLTQQAAYNLAFKVIQDTFEVFEECLS